MRNYGNQSVESLYALLNDVVLDIASNLQKACEILYELKARGEHHLLMREGLLRRFEDIASGKLSARAAITFSGVNVILDRITGLPLEEQERLAETGSVAVAELDAKGQVTETQKPILTMAKTDLERVFGVGEIRSVEKQEQLIRQQASTKAATPAYTPTPRIRVDWKTKKLVLSVQRITVEELREPLRQLGFSIVRLKDARDIPAAVKRDSDTLV
ncbi:hypothetical protein ACVDG5_018435 [Mesorhizobium sp. ORM6]